jgi:hypothetical protein
MGCPVHGTTTTTWLQKNGPMSSEILINQEKPNIHFFCEIQYLSVCQLYIYIYLFIYLFFLIRAGTQISGRAFA